MNVFIFGMGYSAVAAARAMRELIDPDLVVSGTTRTREKADRLLRTGLKVHAFDGRAPGLMLGADLKNAEKLIASVPPKDGVDPALQQHRKDLAASPKLEWICYYSTIGVYGDAGGAWIDEKAPLVPSSDRSADRVAAEQAWRDFAAEKGIPLAIFRLAGIYGPGRSTFDKMRDGSARRIIKPGQVFNRIHVDDIARLTALAARQNLSGTFNITDDEPAAPQDPIEYASKLSGLPLPDEVPFDEADLSDMARSFYDDCKRVSNAAIKKALGVELLYPSYRSGLRAIFDLEARQEDQ
ncbi:MAG: SDR family oxidoreductase [Hyphomicrobiaceae bacterium]|nr:SDR family oxidoreductase [Hyphomicrobiaceae bacterium]